MSLAPEVEPPEADPADDTLDTLGADAVAEEVCERSARNRLRILVFTPSYPPVACGVGDYTRGLAAALTRGGHDVTVITGVATTTKAERPVRVLPLLRNWDVSAFLRAWPRFARPRPDLVVS